MYPLLDRVNRIVLRHRNVWAALCAVAAAVCMALSAYYFRPQARSLIHYRPTQGGPQSYFNMSAPWWFVLGVLFLLLALILTRRLPLSPVRTWNRIGPLRPWWARVFVVPGAAALFAFAEANGHYAGVEWLWDRSPEMQIALLVVGIALLVIGFGGWEKTNLTPRPPLLSSRRGGEDSGVSHDAPRSTYGEGEKPCAAKSPLYWMERGFRGEVGILLLLALIALGVRFYQLGDSVRVLIDEVHFLLGVNYVRAYDNVRLLEPMPTAASFPFIFSYGQWLTSEVFGRNLLGLRAFSAILGALTVPALYTLGHALFDRTTALLAALILLTFPPHIHYSRLGLNNIADPLFGTLGLAFLARGFNSGRRLDYALGGAMLGLTQYFYEGGRIIYPALAAAWIVGGMIVWRPQPSLRGAIIVVIAFVVVAAPVYYTLVGLDFPLADRMDKATYSDYYWGYEREEDNLLTRVRHFGHSLLTYINGPENTVFHYYIYYGGQHPLIHTPLVPLFLIGLIISLWRWREPAVILTPWILATSVGNALLIESAVSARYVVAFPAIALLIALAARDMLALVWPVIVPRQIIGGLLVVLGVGIAVWQVDYYFNDHLPLFNTETRQFYEADADDALLRSVDYPPGTVVHLVGVRITPPRDAQHFMDYLADGIVVESHHPDDVTAELLAGLRRDVDHAFYVAPHYTKPLALLASVFGPQPLQPPDDPRIPPEKGMLRYYLPADPNAPSPPPAVGG